MTPARFPDLSALGKRIVILGPACSGKSTLAHALSERLSIQAVHLDALFHQPGTEWAPRPPEAFVALHAAAIAANTWAMDGNYPRLMSERLARATAIIWLDLPTLVCLLRYFRRCMLAPETRIGGLEGGSERVH